MAATVSSPLQAQQQHKKDTPRPIQIGLTGLSAGFCTEFLAGPKSVALLTPIGRRPVRADQAPNLPPPLKAALAEQGEYGGWTPGRVCVYRFTQAQVDGHTAGGDAGRDGSTLAIIGLLTSSAKDGPAYVAHDILTNYGGLATLLGAAHIRVATYGLKQEGPRDRMPDLRLRLRVGSAQLVWEGALSRDSVAVAEPVEARWLVAGPLNRWLTLTSRIGQPASSRAFVGAMRVEGKRSWRTLFAESPVRHVGPMLRGGDVEMTVEP